MTVWERLVWHAEKSDRIKERALVGKGVSKAVSIKVSDDVMWEEQEDLKDTGREKNKMETPRVV